MPRENSVQLFGGYYSIEKGTVFTEGTVYRIFEGRTRVDGTTRLIKLGEDGFFINLPHNLPYVSEVVVMDDRFRNKGIYGPYEKGTLVRVRHSAIDGQIFFNDQPTGSGMKKFDLNSNVEIIPKGMDLYINERT